MKRHALFFAVLALVAFLLVRGGRASAEADAAREAARTLGDSLEVLAPILADVRAAADAQAALVLSVRDSLDAERALRAEERQQAAVRVAVATQTGAAALDSARSRVSEEVRAFLDEHEANDSATFVGYESQIASLVADAVADSVELAETTRALLLSRQECAVCSESLTVAIARGDALDRVANPPFVQRLVAGLPFGSTQGTVGFVLGLAAGFVLTR